MRLSLMLALLALDLALALALLSGCAPTAPPVPTPEPDGPVAPGRARTLDVWYDRPGCPRCERIIAAVRASRVPGLTVRAERNDGRIESRRHNVTTRPTWILRDQQGRELGRRTGHVYASGLVEWILSVRDLDVIGAGEDDETGEGDE